MNWLKKNWVWLLINIIAIVPLISIFSVFKIDLSGSGPLISAEMPARVAEMQGVGRFAGKHLTALWLPIHSSGEWSIKWLTACLLITPLSIIFGSGKIMRYRKLFGIYAFAYSLIHTLFFIADRNILAFFDEFNFILGLISFAIMLPLAITSNKWSIRQMGKKWKTLQRFAYGAAVLAILHVVLLKGGGQWQIYAVLTAIGFIVRMPQVKQFFVSLRNRKKATALAADTE